MNNTLQNPIIHSPSKEEIIDHLQLYRSQNVGPATFFRLVEVFGSVRSAIENFNGFFINKNPKRSIKILPRDEAEKELEEVEKFNARILLYHDPKYPQLLREIHDFPPLITIKGNIEILENKKIAVVGARNASMNALSFARRIAVEISQSSLTTVSGMAKGIDTTIHEASILGGTIAVLGGGIDNVYPAENKRLYDQISKSSLLISEKKFNSTPKPENFVQRNRIISGLSLAVIVVEASLNSGSLTTARFALQQNRDLYAVPGSPFDCRCFGCNRLIKDGANMITDVEDLYREISDLKCKYLNLSKKSDLTKTVQLKTDKTSNHQIPSGTDIDKLCNEIVKKLDNMPIEINEIISELNVSSNIVNAALIQLELLDKVEINQGRVSARID